MREEWRGIIQKKDDGSEKINYNDETFPAYINDGYICATSSWGNVPHFHADIEFITVYKGHMGYNINGETVLLNSGDTLMVNSEQIHYSFSNQDDKCHYIICILHPKLLCSSVSVEEKYVNPVISNSRLPYLIFKSQNEVSKEVYDIAFNMLQNVNNHFKISKEYFNLWNIILENCIEDVEKEVDFHSNPSFICMKKMITYCHNNYDKNIRLKDIADYAGVSNTYCNHLFHKYINCTPIEGLTRIRLEKAAGLLLDSELSINEIAEKTGFSGASYFSETFKRIYGKSPKKYQKDIITERKRTLYTG